jgi:2-polyprenyl-3-methyl-5-hydroxy-6-metoxy-1,4-benzoquinol methylase
VEFRSLDIEKLDSDDIGQFDVMFCFGILYHLENPVLAMKKLANVSSDIMLVTPRL